MKRTHIYITNEEDAGLKEIQKASGLAITDLIRRAIDEYISNYQKLLEKSAERKRLQDDKET